MQNHDSVNWWKAYMWISFKIQFQQTLIILPKIVYKYSGPMILHVIKLEENKTKIRNLETVKFILKLKFIKCKGWSQHNQSLSCVICIHVRFLIYMWHIYYIHKWSTLQI